MNTLTVAQAARRLGVKPPTLYAYVSRGVLRSRRAPDGRTSLFDARDIERLAQRGRPRRSTRTAALDIEIETSLTSIEREQLRYRGHDVGHLARRCSFEEVAELLWTGTLGTSGVTWPTVMIGPVSAAPTGAERVFDRLTAAVASAATNDPSRDDRSPAAITGIGPRLISALVESLPVAGEGRTPRLHLPERDPLRGSIAGRLWGRLAPARPPAGGVAALNAALVLLADHELAASTLAVRVAASTRADPYATVAAGLATASGPMHGAASRSCRLVIERAAATSSDAALAEARAELGLFPGFGQRLYPHGDPRATALLELVRTTWAGNRRVAQVDAVAAAARRRADVHPNVDFALAALGHVAGMPADAGEAVFAIARSAGWLAHTFEEYLEPPVRFRPRALFRSPT